MHQRSTSGNDIKDGTENKKRDKDCFELLVGVRDQTEPTVVGVWVSHL